MFTFLRPSFGVWRFIGVLFWFIEDLRLLSGGLGRPTEGFWRPMRDLRKPIEGVCLPVGGFWTPNWKPTEGFWGPIGGLWARSMADIPLRSCGRKEKKIGYLNNFSERCDFPEIIFTQLGVLSPPFSGKCLIISH